MKRGKNRSSGNILGLVAALQVLRLRPWVPKFVQLPDVRSHGEVYHRTFVAGEHLGVAVLVRRHEGKFVGWWDVPEKPWVGHELLREVAADRFPGEEIRLA